jgi:hypothetical protein
LKGILATLTNQLAPLDSAVAVPFRRPTEGVTRGYDVLDRNELVVQPPSVDDVRGSFDV